MAADGSNVNLAATSWFDCAITSARSRAGRAMPNRHRFFEKRENELHVSHTVDQVFGCGVLRRCASKPTILFPRASRSRNVYFTRAGFAFAQAAVVQNVVVIFIMVCLVSPTFVTRSLARCSTSLGKLYPLFTSP